MRDELRRFIRDNQLIAPGDTVTCAVSGGADSMALLWALHTMCGELDFRLRCAHFNHGLRPEADGEEAFVRSFCEANAIAFVSARADVAAQALPGESLELAARRLRYDFLRRAAAPGLLATAHTADDNLETVLLRLTRGTSPRGLGGIPVKAGTVIRPLLFATRAQIIEFLRAEGIDHREDPSNAADFCPRNRLRHHVVPLLRAENPAIASGVGHLSQLLREEDAYLSALADAALSACRTSDGWDCTALRALPPVLQRRALFAILQQCAVETPTMRHMEQLRALLLSSVPSASASFPGGLRLERHYDCLTVAADAAAIVPTPLNIPGVTVLPEAGLRIRADEIKISQKVENTPIQFLLNCDMIGNVVVRSRERGDSLCLPGGSRSLKRLMIDRKIPASRRALVPVLADEAGVIAVGGIGADLRRLARPGDRAIQIQIEKEEMRMNGDIEKVLISEAEIQTGVAKLGKLLAEEYADKNPVFLGVLKGVVVFFSDMIRAIPIPCEIDFIAVSSYGSGTEAGTLVFRKDVSVDIKDRHVVILEDILDTGKTLKRVVAHLQQKQPASLKICTLLDKPDRREVDIEADYVGFTIPNEFVVGYGLDYAEGYRNLPFVGVLKPEIYNKNK